MVFAKRVLVLFYDISFQYFYILDYKNENKNHPLSREKSLIHELHFLLCI